MSRRYLVPILLPADPAAPMEAATKQYVDANTGGGLDQATADTLYVNVSGDTMSAALVLPASDPVGANDAARKAYVDSQVATRLTPVAADTAYVNVGGDTMTGNLVVGTYPTGAGNQIEAGGVSRTHLDGAAAANQVLYRSGNSANTGQAYVGFWRGTPTGSPTQVGSIAVASASSVVYNTTSDRRLKQPTGDVIDAADLIAGLASLVYRGRWISDPPDADEWVFLNSQDVQLVAPFAVHGDPDGVATEDDVATGRASEVGEIIPQQLDHGALVPLLVAALGQALDRISVLEARFET